jgi:hypothetical protein
MAEESQLFRLLVPAQGIDQTLSIESSTAFFDSEISFYNRLSSITDTNFSFANTGLGNVVLARNAINNLNDIKKNFSTSSLSTVENYMHEAQAMRILIGQGIIGKRVDDLLKAGSHAEAKWIAYMTSPAWLSADSAKASEIFTAIRASLTANPAFYGSTNIISAEQALENSSRALDASSKTANEIEEYRKEKTSLFSQLEDLYRQKLVLDEPALLWFNIADSKTRSWRIWLFIFACLIISPILIGLINRDAVLEIFKTLTVTASGAISVAGLAVITVPALFYAWLLKNVSRVFIQNLNLADDAAHRRALALTYLGLAENPKLSVAEQDRALILNALFRPVPPQTGDEGPPVGLLDLIRKKD